MKTKFGLKNFRVFDDKGVTFDLKPITILTGENSSGKSSLVKAMLIMRNYFRAVKNEPTENPAAVQLDFSDPALKMSGFDSALSKFTSSDSITFSYDAAADYAPYDFTVDYNFIKDTLNPTKGILHHICVSFQGVNLIKLVNNNGHLSIKEMNVKELFYAFLIFAKCAEYRMADRALFRAHKSTDTVTSLDGTDITDWGKYAYSVYGSTDTIRDGSDGINLVESIIKSEQSGLIFYFPVLESFNGLSKEESISRLKTFDINSTSRVNGVKIDIEKFETVKHFFIQSFEQSQASTLVEFLCSVEQKYLSSYDFYMVHKVNLICNYLEELFGSKVFNDFTYYSFDESEPQNSYIRNIYTFLHLWQFTVTPNTDSYVKREVRKTYTGEGESIEYGVDCSHNLINAFQKYMQECLNDLVIPNIFEQLNHVGSSFTPVQRLYSYEENSKLVLLLKEYKRYSHLMRQHKKSAPPPGLEKSRFFSARTLGEVDYQVGSFTNKWLSEMHIAKELLIEEDELGLGFRLFLRKDNQAITSLADEGRGITQVVLILLQIEVAIMQTEIRAAVCPPDYTVCIDYSTLAIEEPEVSLHPNWQSKLAEIFVDANKKGVHFIVETHSEYLIRKTQAMVANYKTKEEFDRMPFVVYYIEQGGTAYDLEYTNTGRFAKSFGPGFLDEASRSSVEILKRERRMKDEA